jgi:putative transposase
MKSSHQAHGTSSDSRQMKYLNHISAPDHRGVKRVTRPLVGFNSCETAQATLVGSELRPMLRTAPWAAGVDTGLPLAEPFYALAS